MMIAIDVCMAVCVRLCIVKPSNTINNTALRNDDHDENKSYLYTLDCITHGHGDATGPARRTMMMMMKDVDLD
uniref:Putative secreted protein n=1 Tax=Anopheles darlingi TaxID=43151 RepID=A0A2M4DH86_ANODA